MISRRAFVKGVAGMVPLSMGDMSLPRELCPVCKTVQLTYEVRGQEGRYVYIVKHDWMGKECPGSHFRIGN